MSTHRDDTDRTDLHHRVVLVIELRIQQRYRFRIIVVLRELQQPLRDTFGRLLRVLIVEFVAQCCKDRSDGLLDDGIGR